MEDKLLIQKRMAQAYVEIVRAEREKAVKVVENLDKELAACVAALAETVEAETVEAETVEAETV